MARLKQRKCDLFKCENDLFLKGVAVGYRDSKGVLREINVCNEHGYLIANAGPGTFHITDRLEFKPIPAKPTIII